MLVYRQVEIYVYYIQIFSLSLFIRKKQSEESEKSSFWYRTTQIHVKGAKSFVRFYQLNLYLRENRTKNPLYFYYISRSRYLESKYISKWTYFHQSLFRKKKCENRKNPRFGRSTYIYVQVYIHIYIYRSTSTTYPIPSTRIYF